MLHLIILTMCHRLSTIDFPSFVDKSMEEGSSLPWTLDLLSFLLIHCIYIFLPKLWRSSDRRRVMARIPLSTYGQEMRLCNCPDKRCPICFEDYNESDGVRVLPACKHFFHAACLESWLEKAATFICPICRRHAFFG